MNGIRKLAFHAARYNRQKYLDSDVRSRPLQSVRRAFFSYRTPHGCNIAEGNDPPSEAVAEVWHRFFENFSAADFSPHLRRASCTFVCRKTFRHTKGARSARLGGVPESRHLTTYDMTSSKKRIGRPTTTDPRVHRYNFKLTTEENIRFKQMLCKAGLEHNRSQFIVKRIFNEEFVVIKRDRRYSSNYSISLF